MLVASKTGRYFEPGRYLGSMNELFSGVSALYVLHQKTRAHACIAYKMYGHVSIHSRPGHSHGHGRLHGSNVLTCCTWVCTRRVGAISDGRYFGWALLRACTVCCRHYARCTLGDVTPQLACNWLRRQLCLSSRHDIACSSRGRQPPSNNIRHVLTLVDPGLAP